MAKGTKFEKDEITALKRIANSQREISKALGSSKNRSLQLLEKSKYVGNKKTD